MCNCIPWQADSESQVSIIYADFSRSLQWSHLHSCLTWMWQICQMLCALYSSVVAKGIKRFKGIRIQTEIDSPHKSGRWEGCTHNNLLLVFPFLTDFVTLAFRVFFPSFSLFLLLCLHEFQCIVLAIPESLASSFRIWSFLRWIWEETSSLELLPSDAWKQKIYMKTHLSSSQH